MIDFEKQVIEEFQKGLEALADKAKQELAAQGHRATGKGIESIEAQITSKKLDKLVGVILANDYLLPVDRGVSSQSVPFSGRSGNRSSKYISALMDWVSIIKPGMSDNERRSFVFAIAHTHKKEGIPSRGSYSFSENGRRKSWIQYGIEENENELQEAMDMFRTIKSYFDHSIQKAAA